MYGENGRNNLKINETWWEDSTRIFSIEGRVWIFFFPAKQPSSRLGRETQDEFPCTVLGGEGEGPVEQDCKAEEETP